MANRELTFLTRPGCSLCAAALPRLQQAAHRLRVPVVEVDITTDPELEAKYHLRIPVVLDRRGRVIAEGMITTIRAWSAVLRARAW